MTDFQRGDRVRICEKADIYLHHLVLEAFVGPRPDDMEACHFPKSDPNCNFIENLRWDTPAGNTGDKEIHGTIFRGEQNKNRKWTKDAVLEVRRLRAAGLTYKQITQRTGVSNSQVGRFIKGETFLAPLPGNWSPGQPDIGCHAVALAELADALPKGDKP